MIHETKDHPPLFELPRWKRRRRLRKIIALRRKGKTPPGIWITGWRVGVPTHPELFQQSVYLGNYYSVRGNGLHFRIYRVKDSAIKNMIGD